MKFDDLESGGFLTPVSGSNQRGEGVMNLFKDALGTWTPSERDKKLYEVGMEYEYACEKYDQMVCREK